MTPALEPDGNSAHAASPKGNWINYAAKSFGGGKGTKKKPYIIKTASQLAHLAKIVNESSADEKSYTKYKYYKLTKDIDLSAHYWTPIGKADGNAYKTFLYGKAFRGVFDGGGHTIKGLRVAKDEDYGGLFGLSGDISQSMDSDELEEEFGNYDGFNKDLDTERYLPEREFDEGLSNKWTEIKNVKLPKARVNAKRYAGGIVGYAMYIDIIKCHVSGSIKGGADAGGLIGRGLRAYSEDSSVSGRVSSGGEAGGIYGAALYSSNSNSIVKAKVSGKKNVGGYIGLHRYRVTYHNTFKAPESTIKVNVSGDMNVG
jgi:hypothetical protein